MEPLFVGVGLVILGVLAYLQRGRDKSRDFDTAFPPMSRAYENRDELTRRAPDRDE